MAKTKAILSIGLRMVETRLAASSIDTFQIMNVPAGFKPALR